MHGNDCRGCHFAARCVLDDMKDVVQASGVCVDCERLFLCTGAAFRTEVRMPCWFKYDIYEHVEMAMQARAPYGAMSVYVYRAGFEEDTWRAYYVYANGSLSRLKVQNVLCDDCMIAHGFEGELTTLTIRMDLRDSLLNRFRDKIHGKD